MSHKSLHISLSDNNRPHVETISDFEKSLFRQQYEQSFYQINSILLANRAETNVEGVECNNNIVVFDGDRGTGKTSCMLSVANMLTEQTPKFFEQYPQLAHQRFIKLPMLEPSFFDKEHNAVTLFVSRLYKYYLNFDKTGRNEQDKHNLLTQFVCVQQSIKCILGDFEPKDGLDYLVGLSSAIDLRKDLYKLVKLFLDYIGQENSTLLVLIDDIDINPKMAEDMAEQVRKYLVLPNAIVLVSMKIDQFLGILDRQYTKEYLNTKVVIDEKDRAEIHDRVEKYVTKLFPRSQRVYMPESESVLNSYLTLDDRDLWNYKLPDDLLIRQIVPELIYKKTRYLFYNTNKRASYIVPRNLRELRQLLTLLLSMPDYIDDKEESLHIENKSNFKKYFFEDWTANNLNEKHREIASKLVAVEVMEELNYEVLNILTESIGTFSWNSNSNVSIDEVLDKHNNSVNISLGDVLSIIRIIENADPSDDNRKILFFIRSLYSIRLYEAYDSIKENSEENSYTVVNRGLHRIVKNDYEAIIGGSVCNAMIFDYLPIVTENSRISTRFISYESVSNLAFLCTQHWDEDEGIYVKLMELILLCIYYDDATITTAQNNFRKNENVCYRVINPGATQYCIDLGALMFNLSRWKDAVDRFRRVPELHDFFKKYGACSKDKFLMKDLLDNVLTDERQTKYYRKGQDKWMASCCFRNIEILDDFLSFIKGRVPRILRNERLYDSSEPFDAVQAFFDLASRYCIKSYDRYDNDDEKDISYKIGFKFYRVISGLLKNDKFKSEFMKIFYSKEAKYVSTEETIPL